MFTLRWIRKRIYTCIIGIYLVRKVTDAEMTPLKIFYLKATIGKPKEQRNRSATYC